MRRAAEEMLAAARTESDEKLRHAAEQTAWATQTVESVLAGAATEADVDPQGRPRRRR